MYGATSDWRLDSIMNWKPPYESSIYSEAFLVEDTRTRHIKFTKESLQEILSDDDLSSYMTVFFDPGPYSKDIRKYHLRDLFILYKIIECKEEIDFINKKFVFVCICALYSNFILPEDVIKILNNIYSKYE